MRGFLRTLGQTIARHPISFFAVLIVAATGAFAAYMTMWQTEILASPDWCSKALQAERVSSESAGGMTSCHDILVIQLKALATNSHIDHGGLILVLIVLVVVVIAGARLALAASAKGVSANIGREEVEAAQHVVDKAEEGLEEVEAAAGAAPARSDAGLPDNLK